MRLKDYSCLLLIIFMSCSVRAQFQISGKVTDAVTGLSVIEVDLYDKEAGVVATTDIN
jgi:Fe(3+) dicitrate transport protein